MAFQLHEAYSLDDLDELLKTETPEIISEVTDYKNATSPIRAKKHYIKDIIKKGKTM